MADNTFTMTKAQKDSAIKKINERYIQICREFGTHSGIAKDYLHTMELIAGSENIQVISSTTTKKAPKNNPNYNTGEIRVEQIKRSKKALDAIDPNDIRVLLNKHTAGEVKKTAREEARRQSQETGQNISMSDVIEDMDYVYDFLDEHGYDSQDSVETKNAFDFYWSAKGPGSPRPTYSELRLIMETQKQARELMEQGDEQAAIHLTSSLHRQFEKNKRDVFGGL